MTQQAILLAYLKDENTWKPAPFLCARNTRFGWLGSQGDKRARELFALGLLERRPGSELGLDSRYKYYRYKTLEAQQLTLV